MCASGRKSMLELPLKVILTENGASSIDFLPEAHIYLYHLHRHTIVYTTVLEL